jgi:hypothetical protein
MEREADDDLKNEKFKEFDGLADLLKDLHGKN